MKKTFLLIVLSACFTSCWKVNKKTEPLAKLTTHKEAIDSLRINDKEKPILYERLSSSEISDALSVLDIAPLFIYNNEDDMFSNRIDGLYGIDNYRIEMYFSECLKDKKSATLYHVKGKTRFKNNIIPFEGNIIIDSLAKFEDPNIDSSFYLDNEIKNKSLYSGFGRFSFKEDSTMKGSGVFNGKIALDFYIQKNNTINLWFFSPKTLAQASGYKLTGNWQSYKTKQIKPVIFAKDIFTFANEILADFSIGERDIEINPKYRHLGWDNYWAMKEWWIENKPQ